MRKVPFETMQSSPKLIQCLLVRPLIVGMLLSSCVVASADESKSQHNRVRPVIQSLGETSQGLWGRELDLSQNEKPAKRIQREVVHQENTEQTVQVAFQDEVPKPAIENTQKSLKAGTLYKSLTDNQKSFDNLSASELQDLFDFKDPSEFSVNTGYNNPELIKDKETKAIVLPDDVAKTLFAQASDFGSHRDWDPTIAQWEAPAFYHRPLYFEEVNLERYGHRKKVLQPALSAAHFFGNTLALPYKIGVNHPCERVYTLGHYRPGDCNPHDRHGLPWSFKGAVYAGGFYTGLVFFVP
ncbi:MAG: hypothetical protein COA78_22970 [Blastopirellula sp.]|nr:MAG: hypothetical protein COA78_22970 [Blastopirellula sp.]